MNTFWHAVFPPSDPAWAWRRRVIFAGCIMALLGVAKAQWFEADHSWGTVLLAQSWAAFAATAGLYLGLSVTDAHLKRETERKAAEAPTTMT